MKISDIVGISEDVNLYREDTSLVSNSIGVGVELELENICVANHPHQTNTPLPNKYWNAVTDGSLRHGTEFVFKGALFGANITGALDEMTNFLTLFKRSGEPVEITERCSVHVHLDVRDMSDAELTNLILIYLLFERVIFGHISPSRLKNTYCRPLSDSSFKHTLIQLRNEEGNMHRVADIVRDQCDKYSALNVLPILRFGSIEFRHHQGTKNMEQIKNWINIIMKLKVLAKETGIATLLLSYPNFSLESVVEIFAGTALNEENLRLIPNVETLIDSGVYDVSEILNIDTLIRIQPRKKIRKAGEVDLLSNFYVGEV